MNPINNINEPYIEVEVPIIINMIHMVNNNIYVTVKVIN